MTEPEQIRLKRKYVVGQTNGRYKSGHNDNRAARPKRGNPTQVSTTIMVLLPNGKKRFMKRDDQ